MKPPDPKITKSIKLFQNGAELTVKDLEIIFSTDRETARRIVDRLTLEIPIYERKIKREQKGRGRPAPIFKLLDKDELDEVKL